MKIGILTLPLHTNYGGLLQNYALQQILKDYGHTVYTLNKDTLGLYSSRSFKAFWVRLKQVIKKYIGREYLPSYSEYCIIREECIKFINDNIDTTRFYKNNKDLTNIIEDKKFDAYIVGSDQVWRPNYSKNIYNDFLDFCQNKNEIKRIAYAVSFGVNEWLFNTEQTKKCSLLAKSFHAISMREDSGVELCYKYLGVNATLVLDPTLLLSKERYIQLINKSNVPISKGKLFCYILDNSKAIENGIQEIERKLSIRSFQVKANKNKGTLKYGEKINNYIIPSPIKWLRAFMDAEMVFTDSFHGCVFSIIFNKPFWVIGNKDRGNARFDSLLKLFNLENRRIDINELNEIDLNAYIDWDKINKIKEEWQKKSINFIIDNL